jgi:protein TonB
MSGLNTASADLLDYVFEHRNKAYGAYYLRRHYENHLIKAFTITALLFGTFFVGPFLWEKYKPAPPPKEELKIVSFDAKMIDPPPIDPKLPPPPPLPAGVPPPKISTVKFVPPVVAPDEEVIDEPPKQEDFKKAVSGTETVQGDPEADPNELSFDQVGDGSGGAGALIGGEGEPEEEFTFVEQMPTFSEGDVNSYLARNIKYPPRALQADIEGVVYVSFVVGTDGSVSDAKILKGIGFGCDEEALRVVNSMPKWIPGKQSGRPVRVRVSISVKFRISQTGG